MCNIKIHETQPLLNLKLDRVMQDIVYKLVPGLQESMSGNKSPSCLNSYDMEMYFYDEAHHVFLF